jgi:hypothetical protein
MKGVGGSAMGYTDRGEEAVLGSQVWSILIELEILWGVYPVYCGVLVESMLDTVGGGSVRSISRSRSTSRSPFYMLKLKAPRRINNFTCNKVMNICVK